MYYIATEKCPDFALVFQTTSAPEDARILLEVAPEIVDDEKEVNELKELCWKLDAYTVYGYKYRKMNLQAQSEIKTYFMSCLKIMTKADIVEAANLYSENWPEKSGFVELTPRKGITP